MSKISINISEELQSKLVSIANKNHISFEECIEAALCEYADNNENFYQSDFCSVNQLERSFFFSAAE